MDILNWLYPPHCIACRQIIPAHRHREISRGVCENCEPLFVPLSGPRCAGCGHPLPQALPVKKPTATPTPPAELPVKLSTEVPQPGSVLCASCRGASFSFAHNQAAFAYADVVRDVIHDMKFRNSRAAAQGLGAMLAECIRDFHGADFLTPVPMHPQKQRKRGFNQAEELARALSEKYHIPIAPALLRTVNTPPQSGLSYRGRIHNMRGVFRINPKVEVKNKNICLIDDIYTTGATLNSCAETLMKDAQYVTCVTFSITLKKGVNFSQGIDDKYLAED